MAQMQIRPAEWQPTQVPQTLGALITQVEAERARAAEQLAQMITEGSARRMQAQNQMTIAAMEVAQRRAAANQAMMARIGEQIQQGIEMGKRAQLAKKELEQAQQQFESEQGLRREEMQSREKIAGMREEGEPSLTKAVEAEMLAELSGQPGPYPILQGMSAKGIDPYEQYAGRRGEKVSPVQEIYLGAADQYRKDLAAAEEIQDPQQKQAAIERAKADYRKLLSAVPRERINEDLWPLYDQDLADVQPPTTQPAAQPKQQKPWFPWLRNLGTGSMGGNDWAERMSRVDTSQMPVLDAFGPTLPSLPARPRIPVSQPTSRPAPWGNPAQQMQALQGLGQYAPNQATSQPTIQDLIAELQRRQQQSTVMGR